MNHVHTSGLDLDENLVLKKVSPSELNVIYQVL